MSWSQNPKPHLHPVETGRLFAPPYDTELTVFNVTTAEWKHVCSARFGEGRPCGFTSHDTTKWTGDSYRYDIFQRAETRGEWALRWWNGSGEGWLVTDYLGGRSDTCLLEVISNTTEEPRRWDACHFLWQIAFKTALAASRREEARYERAFLEGRLKKVKGRNKGSYRVEIKQA